MGSTASQLEREARFAAGGDLTELPEEFVYVQGGPARDEVSVILERLGQSGFKPPYGDGVPGADGDQLGVLYLTNRNILVAGGERAGKSHVSGEFLSSRVPYGSLFWIVADNYELARPELGYAIDFLGSLGAIESTRDVSTPKVGKASLRTKTGQLIETKTADDVRKLAAVAPDGIVIAEAAQCPYEAYLRCVGRLAEKRGWLLMSGTFEGSLSWYADKYTEWRNPRNFEGGIAVSLPSWGNPYVYPRGRSDPEIIRLETLYSPVEGLFEERCGAVPVPPVGLVFREFRSTVHISDTASYRSDLPVYLAIDPSAGGNPYSVLACQFHPRVYQADHPDKIDDCYVIDEIYERKQDEEIIEEAMTRFWWGQVRGGAIDHEAPDSKKRWLKIGKVHLHSEKVRQLEGIRRLKSFLYYKRDDTGLVTQRPHLLLNPRVKGLSYEFGRFKRKDAVDDDREPREEPPSDQPNHSIKALWYLLIARYGPVKGARIPRVAITWQRPRLSRHSSPLP